MEEHKAKPPHILSLALGVIFSLCSHAEAQPIGLLNYTLSATEILAGTTTPVPAPDGVIAPGEAVLFQISLQFEPPVGTIVSTPQGPGLIAGFGAALVDMQGQGGAEGAWSHLAQASGWNAGGIAKPGWPGPSGSALWAIGFGQFWGGPGAPPVSAQNPIENIWQGVWEPDLYTPRSINWQLSALATPAGFGDLFAQYGTDPTTGFPLYAPVTIGHPPQHRVIQIEIIPAPGGTAALMLAMGVAVRRRRPKRMYRGR